MNFLLLCIQSTVCCTCVALVKRTGIISFRDFDTNDAKAWFPISFLLVSVIYTGSKSLVSVGCLRCFQVLMCMIAILEYTGIHYLQELDNYPHCKSQY